ncbi:hypothetical protein MEN24_17495 [Dolichospermum sp. ST_sed10]|nr:hypothetical protein [Dolichospermum sp. ST_sed10]
MLVNTGFLLEPVEPSFPPEPVPLEPVGDLITDFQDGIDLLQYEFVSGFEELIILGQGTSQVTIKALNEGVPGEIPNYLETIAVLRGAGGSNITITEADFFV